MLKRSLCAQVEQKKELSSSSNLISKLWNYGAIIGQIFMIFLYHDSEDYLPKNWFNPWYVNLVPKSTSVIKAMYTITLNREGEIYIFIATHSDRAPFRETYNIDSGNSTLAFCAFIRKVFPSILISNQEFSNFVRNECVRRFGDMSIGLLSYLIQKRADVLEVIIYPGKDRNTSLYWN